MPTQQERPTRQLRRSELFGPVGHVFVAANTGSWRLEYPKINREVCTACGMCARFCPCDVITVTKGNPDSPVIDWNYCKGCGICSNECPVGCIAMEQEEAREP